MAGMTAVAASHANDAAPRLVRARLHSLIALATAGLPLLLAGWTVVPACAAAAAAQVAFSIRRAHR
jgi:hypothetical protein